jgi:hypothetical protein
VNVVTAFITKHGASVAYDGYVNKFLYELTLQYIGNKLIDHLATWGGGGGFFWWPKVFLKKHKGA